MSEVLLRRFEFENNARKTVCRHLETLAVHLERDCTAFDIDNHNR